MKKRTCDQVLQLAAKISIFVLICTLLISGCCSTTSSTPQYDNEYKKPASITTDGVNYKYKSLKIPIAEDIESVNIAREINSNIYLYINPSKDSKLNSNLIAIDSTGTIVQEFLLDADKGIVTDIYPDTNGLWVLTTKLENDGNAYGGTYLIHFLSDGKQNIEISLHFSTPAQWIMPDTNRSCCYVFEINTLHAVDYKGKEIFSLKGDALYHPSMTPEGDLVICDYVDQEACIKLLDYQNMQWRQLEKVDLEYRKIFSGKTYDLYWNDGKKLCGINLNHDMYYPLFTWLDVGIGSTAFEVCELQDSSFFVAADTGLFIVSRTTNEIEDKLTLATFDYERIESAVLQFNNSQNGFKVVIHDYSEYNEQEEDTSGFEQLLTDLDSESCPDIIDLSGLPISLLANDGFITDLYPFINNDKELNISELNSMLLNSMEFDNKLYEIIPHCMILTTIGNLSTLSYKGPMLITSLNRWFEDKKDAVFNGTIDRYTFLKYMISGSDSPFIDWKTKTCAFTSDEFRSILKLSKSLPEQITEYSNNPNLLWDTISGYSNIIYDNFALHCDEDSIATMLGIPGTERPRYLICPADYSWGISTRGINQDKAWAFIRTFLLDNMQASDLIPLSERSFNLMHDNYVQWINGGGIIELSGPAGSATLHVDNEQYFDSLVGLVNSTTGFYELDPVITSIVLEEAEQYFDNQISIDQATRNIQIRSTQYMTEQ